MDEFSTDETHVNSVMVYVRSTGSDSNSETSASDAKATIGAAIQNARLQGDHSSALYIDVGSGTFGSVEISELSVGHLKISGATDGSVNPDTVLDAGGSGNAAYFRGATIALENIEFSNADVFLALTDNTSGRLTNCYGQGAAEEAVHVFNNSYYRDDSATEFDQSTVTG